jgi:hypothetical protein
VLAVLLWPTAKSTGGSFVASQPVGRIAAKVVWVVMWAGLAALNLQPANLTAGALHSVEDGMADGQPGWLAALITAFTDLSRHNGIALTAIGTVILMLVAVSVLFPPPVHRAGVVAGIVVAAFIWVIGEALGGVFGGQGTDVNSGPLLALIALAYWPATNNPRFTASEGEAP